MTKPSSPDPLAGVVERAREGDATALDELVRSVQHDVYGLAIRMLWDPHDAQDATQEILVKVVTRLDRFRGDSALRTWVYRVAVNHLLTTRRRRVEQRGWTFEAFAEDLAAGLDMGAADASSPAEELLAEEVKVGCTLGCCNASTAPSASPTSSVRLFRSHPHFAAPHTVRRAVTGALTRAHTLLDDESPD